MPLVSRARPRLHPGDHIFARLAFDQFEADRRARLTPCASEELASSKSMVMASQPRVLIASCVMVAGAIRVDGVQLALCLMPHGAWRFVI